MENTDIEKISIILLNYNGWQDTIECIESVLRNDYPNYQVIVVDNNSPNNSMEYLKAWAEGKQENLLPDPSHPLYHLSHPTIKKPIPYIYYTREEAEKGGDKDLERAITKKWQDETNNKKKKNELISTSMYPLIFIQTGENLGFAGGNNVGIKYALKKNFKYIWLLNNDTVIEKNSLSNMIKTFQTNSYIGIIGSKLLRYDNPKIIQTLGGSKKMTWINAGSGDYIYSNQTDGLKCNKIFEINGYIVGASMLIKKEVFEDIGLFDENYFMWAEEADLCFRALKNNWKLFYCGYSNIYHKEGNTTGKGDYVSLFGKTKIRPTYQRFIITGYLDVRNHLYFVKKNYNAILMYIYLIITLPNLIKRVIGIILYDNKKIKRMKLLYKGVIDGISNNMDKTKELSL